MKDFHDIVFLERTGDRTGIRSGVSGVRANRQPNIVFIRPPASNSKYCNSMILLT